MHIYYCFATKMYLYNEFICLLFHCIVYNISNSNINVINYYILIIIILNNTIVIIITKKIIKNNFILLYIKFRHGYELNEWFYGYAWNEHGS